MEKFYVNYCCKGSTSVLHIADTLNEAIKFTDEYVSDYEKVGKDVDPDTDTADIFCLQVWSYDTTNDDDPFWEYETAYFYNR